MFYFASKLISSTLGFLFPAYASYKAIRTNDGHAIEVALMYWVVMAGLHAVENTVEWAINWFPFYYEVKTILIVWLAIPQIQGSTFVYLTYVHPFLLSHESEIDTTWSRAQAQAKAAGLDYLRRAWLAVREAVLGAILAPDDKQAAAALTGGHAAPSHAGVPVVPTHPPPTLHDPISGPASQAWSTLAGSMLRSYGPAALAAGQAVLRPLTAAASPPRNYMTAAARSGASDDAAKRKKFDDLAASGISGRLYTQEVPRRPAALDAAAAAGGKRSASASAALMGATGASASGSTYSSYTRAQLRQRRLELERELAALDSSSSSTSSSNPASAAGTPRSRVASISPRVDEDEEEDADSLRPNPPSSATVRERHTSAPSLSSARHGGSYPPGVGAGGFAAPARVSSSSSSPAGSTANLLHQQTHHLEASAYEQIAREDLDAVTLPSDWGRTAAKQGWKGAPPLSASPGVKPPQQQQPAKQAARPVQQKRSSWLWGYGSGQGQPAQTPPSHQPETKKTD